MTPTATQTLIPFTPNPDPLFVIPTFWYREVFTTPIPQPESGIRGFNLRDLSEEEYVELIKIADLYAGENDLLFFQETRPYLIENQEPVEFVIEEMISKFPETMNRKEILWKLALTRATMGSSESDDWIVSTIEKELNRGYFSPPSLNTFLNQYGFEVEWSIPVFNIFGEGGESSLIVINTAQEWYVGNDGLVLVLRGYKPGDYELVLLESEWNLDRGVWDYREDLCEDGSLDKNNNGINEICLQYQLGFSFFFPTQIYLYEWADGGFRNLAEGLPRYFMDDSITFSPQKVPDAEIALTIRSGTEKGDYYYVLEDSSAELIQVDYFYLQEQVNVLFEEGNFQKIIDLLNHQLESGPPYKTIVEFGENSDKATDTIKYLLGMAYAYNGNFDRALSVFKDLADNPTNPEFPFLSNLSETYIELGEDDFNLISACDIAGDLYDETYQAAQSDHLIFGYSTSWWLINKVCSNSYFEELKLEKVIGPIKIAINSSRSSAALPDQLRLMDVSVLKSEQVDVFDDDVTDWLLLIDNPKSGGYYRLLAVQVANKWEMEYLGGVDTIDFLAYEDAEIKYLTGLEFPALVLDFKGGVELYKTIISEDGFTLELFQKFSENDEKDFQYYFFNTFHEMNVVTSVWSLLVYDDITWEELGWETLWESLIWDPELLAFVPYNPLIVFEDPEFIIQLAQVNQSLNPSYELALAYELTGNEAKAVETYWRVWAEDPGSAWALIARAKLEGVQP